MIGKLADRREDAESRISIERIQARYQKKTGEISTEICTQPRRLLESLLFELLSAVNGSYGCVLRMTGPELAESPFLELVSAIQRDHGGRLTRQYDTLLNRKPDALISTVLSTAQSSYANNKRSRVPRCLPDCRPPIENFVALSLVIDRQTPLVVVVANSDTPFCEVVVSRLERLLEVFASIYKVTSSTKQAHEAIQRYHQDHRHYSRLLDANFNGVMSFDCNGLITAFNPACERCFDVTLESAVGSPSSQFIPAEVLEPLLERAKSFTPEQKIRETHTTSAIDSVGFRADGSNFPIQIAAFYSRIERNVCVTLVIDDISDRYESARQCEINFVELKTLTNLAPVGILQLSANWSCQYANDMWCQLSELNIEESMGEGWISAIHRQDVTDTLDEMRDALRQYQTFKKEFRLHLPLGGVNWVSLNATATFCEKQRLTGYLVVVTDITEKHLAAERLRQLAHHDPLTGLLNRMFFLDHLADSLLDASERRIVALLSIDLDGFKAVNDNLGHDAGDFLLKEVSSRLKCALRTEDTIARMGSDEFVVALVGLTQDYMGAEVAEKIIRSLKKPFIVGNVDVSISASIGVASTSNSVLTADALMKQADIALYSAKELGRSKAVSFSDELSAKQGALSALNSDVRDIVKRRRFALHYQPQLDIKGQQLLGFEALLRMPSKFGTVAMPSEVIDVLENTGLISEVGAWVLMQACQDFSEWRALDLVHEKCTISVNVSAKQLGSPELIDTIKTALLQSNLPPENLIIELTESAFIGNSDNAVEIIKAIKALGVTCSLDDFGTGYSSLAYLSRLPIDHIKIDKSFVLDLGESEERLAIVRAILAMANALDITVVAEGVENPEVVRLLAREGCDAYQGYYFSRPLSAERVHIFLTELSPLKIAQFTSFYDLGSIESNDKLAIVV